LLFWCPEVIFGHKRWQQQHYVQNKLQNKLQNNLQTTQKSNKIAQWFGACKTAATPSGAILFTQVNKNF
jgi:hypothetical protein